MDGLAIVLIIAIIAMAISSEGKASSGGGVSANLNEITYPDNTECDNCGADIPVTPETIDTSTWDLECLECGKIGFRHPKREERKEQLDWLTEDIK